MGVFDPAKTLQMRDETVTAQTESDGSRLDPYMNARMGTTRVFVSQQCKSLVAATGMAYGQDIEWYVDETMIRAIVEDMAANVGRELPSNTSVSNFIKLARDPPVPKYTTKEIRPVMIESFVVVVHATSFGAFRGQASWGRRRTPAASMTFDRFGNEVEQATHGPLMLLSSLPMVDQEMMPEREDAETESFV